MSLSRRAVIVAGAAAVPACLLPAAFAQEQQPAAAARDAAAVAATAAGGGQAAASMQRDPALATWVLIDGYKQIEVSQLAVEKAQSDAVKAFAQAEIKEHQDVKAKLQSKGMKPLVAVGGQKEAVAAEGAGQPAARAEDAARLAAERAARSGASAAG